MSQKKKNPFLALFSRKDSPGTRKDAWQNPLTGLGTFSDKTLYTRFSPVIRLDDIQLTEMFNGSDLVRKIVEVRAKEMLRQGYDIKTPNDPGLEEDITNALDEMGVNTFLLESMILGRIFGGSAIVLFADDGQDPIMPLDEDKIRSLKAMNSLDRRFISATQYYEDPMQPNFGKPVVYTFTSALGGNVGTCHASRIIRFEGAWTDSVRRRQLNSWTYSVLQAPYDALRGFNQAFSSAETLMSDASQGVFKIEGLLDMIAAGKQVDVATRMQLVDMHRSSNRAIILDSKTEDFTRQATPFAGIPEMLDRFMQRLASAAEMPVSLLMGRSAAGLNATGDTEIRQFYQWVAADQQTVLKPNLMRLLKLICLAKDGPTKGKLPDGLDVIFRPLWGLNAVEQAQLQFTQAQADHIYVTDGVLMPEEVALSRFRGGFSLTTEIDVEMREEMLASATEEALNPTVPDPNDPNQQANQQPGQTTPGKKGSGKLSTPVDPSKDTHLPDPTNPKVPIAQ